MPVADPCLWMAGFGNGDKAKLGRQLKRPPILSCSSIEDCSPGLGLRIGDRHSTLQAFILPILFIQSKLLFSPGGGAPR
jgi:hypothetical protein